MDFADPVMSEFNTGTADKHFSVNFYWNPILVIGEIRGYGILAIKHFILRHNRFKHESPDFTGLDPMVCLP